MSAVAQILHKEINISANMIIFGTESSPELAREIAFEINSMWNEPEATYLIEEESYPIKLRFTCLHLELSDAQLLLKNNRDYRQNFVRIEKENRMSRSMMGYQLGDNSGHWIISDKLGHSTTAAHEFGHALGLPHPKNLDYRGQGIPPIMAPRGTFVDPEYQWNSNSLADEPGGTMNPIYRKVHASELTDIIEKSRLNPTATRWNIGQITNTLYDAVANKLNYQ